MSTFLAPGGTIDSIHGVEVRDPYRWLEDRKLPETDAWIRRQQHLCDEYFLHNSCCGAVRGIVSDALSGEQIDQAARVGGRMFLRKQLSGESQAGIWVKGDLSGNDTLLVDPTANGGNISVCILRICSDASLLAYSVRSSGSDAMEVRIVEVATGETLPDQLPLAYGRGFEFDAEAGGFYYSIEPIGGTDDLSIKYHRLGHPQSSDAPLFSIPWAARRRLVLLSSFGTLAAVVSEPYGVTMVQDLYIADNKDASSWTLLHRGLSARKKPILAHGRLVFLDLEDSENGQLVELRKDAQRVIIPERANVIRKCFAVPGGFLVSYLRDRKPRVERWSTDGKFIGALTSPSGGSVELLSPFSEQGSSVFLLHESYTEPPSLWEVDFSSERWAEPKQISVSDDRIPAIVRESWYTARDNTKIPIILLEPVDRSLSGPRPVILSGYGGFGATEVPRFSRMAKILVGLGATIAKPCIRGGAEFGEVWHRAAAGRNRQTAIDDFVAAARWLVAQGITDEHHMAIIGASNGGLLAAAAVVQRPELFSAVVCTGPLTDMVRFERFDHAYRWRDEYGTVENAEDFRSLLSYSPYHNVKDTVNYPAMLFVTGDADDLCNPAHVRKMAAALQGRPTQVHPILVDYGLDWGHLPTLSVAERIDALSRKIAFFLDQLSITLPEDTKHEAHNS
jgi:prolyl oligopeptidase